MHDILKFEAPNNDIDLGKGEIEIKDVSISFRTDGATFHAVEQTSLKISAGEFVCILGPSGCGKSTLLNSIAGYVSPTTGTVKIDGNEVDGPGPDRGMLFSSILFYLGKLCMKMLLLVQKWQVIPVQKQDLLPTHFLVWLALKSLAAATRPSFLAACNNALVLPALWQTTLRFF